VFRAEIERINRAVRNKDRWPTRADRGAATDVSCRWGNAEENSKHRGERV